MTIFIALITSLYVLLILALIIGWQKIPVVKLNHFQAKTGFSIIVPYRNETENLPVLLNSFLNLKYPPTLFEILLVNDASEDESLEVCAGFKAENPGLPIKLLENKRISNSPKKDAILTAIKNAHFEHIITTDADCEVTPYWLQVYNEKILETAAKLVAGPVSCPPTVEGSWIRAFEEMDFLSLQGAGAGSFGLGKAFMCNGANLCYSKAAFYEVNGFRGNSAISSGDDVFLLQKFVSDHHDVTFLKSRKAIVITKPQPNLKALISQRLRWAAKTPAYTSVFARVLGLVVLLMNFSLIAGCVLAITGWINYQPFLFAFLLKFIVDFALLFKSASFFNRKEVLRSYFWSSILYPFFSSYIAILTLFKGYTWKGRRFSK